MEMEIAMGPWDLESARKTSRRGRFPCPVDLELHEKMLDSTVSRTVPSKPLSTDNEVLIGLRVTMPRGEWTMSCLGSSCVKTSVWKAWWENVKTEHLI